MQFGVYAYDIRCNFTKTLWIWISIYCSSLLSNIISNCRSVSFRPKGHLIGSSVCTPPPAPPELVPVCTPPPAAPPLKQGRNWLSQSDWGVKEQGRNWLSQSDWVVQERSWLCERELIRHKYKSTKESVQLESATRHLLLQSQLSSLFNRGRAWRSELYSSLKECRLAIIYWTVFGAATPFFSSNCIIYVKFNIN